MQPDLTQTSTPTPNRLKTLLYQLAFKLLTDLASGSVSLVCFLAVQFLQEINAMENLFIKLSGVYAFTSQLLFFIACETALKGPFNKVAACGQKLLDGLTSILFYSVFSYFAAKLREIYYTERMRLVRSSSRSDTMFAMCKVLLEWLKAIAVAICLREQGMRYQQDTRYALLTLSYYICTEKLFLDILPNIIATLNLETLDNLEHLYVPIAMNLYALILGAIFNVYLSTTIYAVFAIASSYFLIYLRLKDLYCNYIEKLNMEKKTFASFRQATEEELREWNDICAVCLNPMNRAKVTPCNHLFHPNCLKQCLQISFMCPLCKQSFVNQ